MSWFGKQDDIQEVADRVAASLRESVAKELGGITTAADLQRKVNTLREDLEKLRIEKGRVEEEQKRREREVEHKVGLERKRQEFELEAAKREAIVSVREENLKEDKRRFEEAMKMQNDRLDDMKELLAEMMKRLPSANIEITESRTRGRKTA